MAKGDLADRCPSHRTYDSEWMVLRTEMLIQKRILRRLHLCIDRCFPS